MHTEWNALHAQLKQTLQKEVHIMRELLANMHQEELSLLMHDTGSLSQVLQQRSLIIEQLGALRGARIQTTEQIEKMVSFPPTTEQILPASEEVSIEILSLRDQLMALTEQMNRQHSCNQHLIDHPEQTRIIAQQTMPRPKKKASVATYQINK